MSKEHRKYQREQQAYKDKQQTKFGETGLPRLIIKQKSNVYTILDTNMQVMCSFCLYQDNLRKFLVSTKKGISQTKAKCPECKGGMMMRTLTADMTPEQYAEFCYGYSRSGFWYKVPFTKCKERLAQLGWSTQFWNRYMQLKGENQSVESYEAFIQRKQREQYEEEGGE
jgi:hypothetical protein